jgi:hypothetical protein
MSIRLSVDNSFVTILDPLPREVAEALSNYCSYTVDGAYFSPLYQSGKWDGKKRLFNRNSYKFPSGLLPGVLEEGIIPDPDISDVRVRPQGRIKSKWVFKHPLRDYQESAVELAMRYQRGVLDICTGGGKTVTALRIAHLLGVKTLIIVNTKEAFKDTVDAYNACIEGDPVGMWGSGKKAFGRFVTVATMASAVKAFDSKDPAFVDQNFQCVFFDECLDGDTLIARPNGVFTPLRDIKVGDIVLTPKGRARVKKVWSTLRRASRYTTRSGSIIGSANHIVPYLYGSHKAGRVGLTTLGKASSLLRPVDLRDRLPYSWDEYLYGWFLGDGTCDRGTIKFAFRKDVSLLRGIFSPPMFREASNSRGDTIFTMDKEFAKGFIAKYHIKDGYKTRTVAIDRAVFESGSVGVVKGLFDAEGCRTKSRITFDMTSRECVEQVKFLLESSGVASSYHSYKRGNPKHGTRYRLCIYGESINKFNTLYGFNIERKQISESTRRDFRLYDSERILSVHDAGVRELFDIELDDEDRIFIANGFAVHNCHHLGSDTWHKAAQTLNAFYKYGAAIGSRAATRAANAATATDDAISTINTN